uniref:Ras-GEF domain-containing protein n=1 Tax=Anisakis simplex TaxID=6269 RepID=A0A0M3JT52_ANISI
LSSYGATGSGIVNWPANAACVHDHHKFLESAIVKAIRECASEWKKQLECSSQMQHHYRVAAPTAGLDSTCEQARNLVVAIDRFMSSGCVSCLRGERLYWRFTKEFMTKNECECLKEEWRPRSEREFGVAWIQDCLNKQCMCSVFESFVLNWKIVLKHYSRNAAIANRVLAKRLAKNFLELCDVRFFFSASVGAAGGGLSTRNAAAADVPVAEIRSADIFSSDGSSTTARMVHHQKRLSSEQSQTLIKSHSGLASSSSSSSTTMRQHSKSASQEQSTAFAANGVGVGAATVRASSPLSSSPSANVTRGARLSSTRRRRSATCYNTTTPSSANQTSTATNLDIPLSPDFIETTPLMSSSPFISSAKDYDYVFDQILHRGERGLVPCGSLPLLSNNYSHHATLNSTSALPQTTASTTTLSSMPSKTTAPNGNIANQQPNDILSPSNLQITSSASTLVPFYSFANDQHPNTFSGHPSSNVSLNSAPILNPPGQPVSSLSSSSSSVLHHQNQQQNTSALQHSAHLDQRHTTEIRGDVNVKREMPAGVRQSVSSSNPFDVALQNSLSKAKLMAAARECETKLFEEHQQEPLSSKQHSAHTSTSPHEFPPFGEIKLDMGEVVGLNIKVFRAEIEKFLKFYQVYVHFATGQPDHRFFVLSDRAIYLLSLQCNLVSARKTYITCAYLSLTDIDFIAVGVDYEVLYLHIRKDAFMEDGDGVKLDGRVMEVCTACRQLGMAMVEAIRMAFNKQMQQQHYLRLMNELQLDGEQETSPLQLAVYTDRTPQRAIAIKFIAKQLNLEEPKLECYCLALWRQTRIDSSNRLMMGAENVAQRSGFLYHKMIKSNAWLPSHYSTNDFRQSFFVLNGKKLYQFEDSTCKVGERVIAIQEMVSNVLELKGCEQSPHMFQIEFTNGDKYELICASADDLRKWVSLLNFALSTTDMDDEAVACIAMISADSILLVQEGLNFVVDGFMRLLTRIRLGNIHSVIGVLANERYACVIRNENEKILEWILLRSPDEVDRFSATLQRLGVNRASNEEDGCSRLTALLNSMPSSSDLFYFSDAHSDDAFEL